MNTKLLSKNDIQISKGARFVPWTQTVKDDTTHMNQKVVVFDLDETLGSFADLYILWCGVCQIWPSCNHFDLLLDTYPEFFRYGMLTILEYLYDCKRKGICQKIFVYTNNQCSVTWVKRICNYIESHIQRICDNPDESVKLFDQHICAFKINNKPVELCRTTHQKCLDDFFRCSMISENADICFIDDVEYPFMKGSAVYYICPRAYIHPLSTKEIIRRMLKSTWVPSPQERPEYSILLSKSYWQNWFYIHRRRMIRKGFIDLSIDLQISQKMIYHLSEFLHSKTWNTQPILKKSRSEKPRMSRRHSRDYKKSKSIHNVTMKNKSNIP